VIRYETPFHIRCLKCSNMIAKGVRFNAEKRGIGKYHSTRIWEFSMRCPACSNKIVVQTDPENTEYKYIEGAYKILTTETATDAEFIRNPEEVRRIRDDPFAKLENHVQDVTKAEEDKPRL